MKIFFLVFLFPFSGWGLTPEAVVKSSLEHYPQVLQSVLGVKEEQNKLKERQGVFDAKLKGDLDSRTEGYYDGDAYKLQIEKPLPYFNSKLYGGARQSYGDFPLYEGKSVTRSGGETFAGISLSLLRDSLIDQRRFDIIGQKQEVQKSQLDLEQVKIQVQTAALQAYWTWYVKGHELNVYKNLLGLALTRSTQIKKRVKAGDLARIYKVENDQYIRKREAAVAQSELEFAQAAFYLSLFYRNQQGRPNQPLPGQLPPFTIKSLQGVSGFNTIYSPAIEKSLDLKKLIADQNQAQASVRLGTNEILPKVDVNFEWNQDQGFGPTELGNDENRIMLKVEIPIEYNKGLGKRRAGQAKLDRIETKRRFTQEKVLVQSKTLSTKINTLTRIFSLTMNEVDLARRLAKAELRKFTQGASDLLRVNIREEGLAEAQIKNLEVLLKYHFVEAEVRNLKVDFL